MLIRPYKPILNMLKKNENVEFRGIVENNLDPLMLGKVQVRIDVYDDFTTEDLPWASPTPDSFLGASADNISFHVPEIGTEVRVYFPTKDFNAPFYKGVEMNNFNKCTFFDEDYPNCYGQKDSKGNFSLINKATGVSKFQHSSTTNIQIEEDGAYNLSTPDGSYLECASDGNFQISGTSTVIRSSTPTEEDSDEQQVSLLTITSDGYVFTANSVKLDVLSTTITGNLDVLGDVTCGNGYSGTLPLEGGGSAVVVKGIVISGP